MTLGWDRTDEFLKLVQSHGGGPASSDGSSAAKLRHLPVVPGRYGLASQELVESNLGQDQETQFSRDAAAIGRELNQTTRKIGELQKFAKHKGIFEDHSAEIQALSYDIRQTIIALNSRIDVLERTSQTSSEASHDQVHHRSVIQTLRTKLGEITGDLKVILEQRAQAMKTQEDRRGLWSHSATPAPQFHELPANSSGDLETGGLLHQSRMQTFAPRESSYHAARAEAVQTIQKMVGELGQIFNRAATLVTAHEELTVRIEDDVSSALHNLQQGEAHLLKYLRSISSNRSLILKVFAILILFVVFFIVFLA